MKKRTKLSGILLVCCMGMSLLVPHSFLAEEAIAQAPDYDRVLAAYGDSAKNYLYQAEAAGKPVSVIQIPISGKDRGLRPDRCLCSRPMRRFWYGDIRIMAGRKYFINQMKKIRTGKVRRTGRS